MGSERGRGQEDTFASGVSLNLVGAIECLFAVLRILVCGPSNTCSCASNACSSFLKPYLQVSCKPCTEVAILCCVVGSEGQATPAFAWPSASLQTEHKVLCRGVADTHGGLPLKSTIKVRIIYEIANLGGLAGASERKIFWKSLVIHWQPII